MSKPTEKTGPWAKLMMQSGQRRKSEEGDGTDLQRRAEEDVRATNQYSSAVGSHGGRFRALGQELVTFVTDTTPSRFHKILGRGV